MTALLPALLLACAAPTWMTAHSLDAGEMQAGFAGYGRYSEVDAELVDAEGQVHGAEPTFRPPQDISHMNLELRVGLGKGLELGTRGVPLLSATDLKWSFLDERRHETPLSVALDLEAGVDTRWTARFRGGLLTSSTLVLGRGLALQPGLGAWLGSGGFGYDVDLDPALVAEGADEARLLLSTRALGLSPTGGLAVPLRITEHLAIAPWAAWVGWYPFAERGRVVECTGCAMGIDALEPAQASLVWGGLRVQPWLEPARRQP